MSSDPVREQQARLRAFARERDWERFHTPKNLVMALAGEVGELLEIFQWLDPNESMAVMQRSETAEAVREELADVMIYLLRIADVLDIDVVAAVSEKIDRNEHRYPAEAVRGRADVPPREVAR